MIEFIYRQDDNVRIIKENRRDEEYKENITIKHLLRNINTIIGKE